ncbi:hypothetical protein H5410_017410 [Solanum commersonii]|uniref:Uncharacterized protein n=1 Tax=Solanum commersonii TaxID=4109 RepID=A0A9J5ZZX2_SOLCO|nr:hypothetical protein H5410_017410 [Solanum commersonii]
MQPMHFGSSPRSPTSESRSTSQVISGSDSNKSRQATPFHQAQNQVVNKNMHITEKSWRSQDTVDTKDTTSSFFNVVHLLGS